jgi:hypothetical protein
MDDFDLSAVQIKRRKKKWIVKTSFGFVCGEL